MTFEPIYYADRLHLVNPQGDTGIITLWSPVKSVLKWLSELAIDLSPTSSRIAVIGNLYGNGLPQMLRNLLWNPQITNLVVLGQNLSGSREELVNFFQFGLEPVEYLGTPSYRIVGTQRIIDGLVTPTDFKNGIQIQVFGKLSEVQTKAGVTEFFSHHQFPAMPVVLTPLLTKEGLGVVELTVRKVLTPLLTKEGLGVVELTVRKVLTPLLTKEGLGVVELTVHKVSDSLTRISVELPKPQVQRYPSEPRHHNILRETPLTAWQELIFRLVRFGHSVTLKKGPRIELPNVKVVITHPQAEPAESLAKYGFSLAHFEEYQKRILSPELSEQSYSYGNRIRSYFHYQGQVVDSLAIVIQRLQADLNSRHAYVSLWDNSRDLSEGHGCPCLVSLFFRYFEKSLTLTATFRTHNAMDAWLENVYGLMAIQEYVATAVGVKAGAITVFSHSISISDDLLDKAKIIAATKQTDEIIQADTGKREPRYDYHGNFAVTIDEQTRELVVQHTYQGAVIAEYRGKSAIIIEQQLARDNALSEIAHALYLGRELAKQEFELNQAN